ncbi:MAG: penicillin-binding protein 2 [Deltaproteobacteria bacterium]|nr:penicillin-binding protein 2 [Deltaproteobacteria bacterium]
MLLRSSSGPGSGNGPSLPELHRRLKWVALLVFTAFACLVGRLWQLQVMRGDSYYERTVSNVVKERYLPSVRGKILDAKGVALADNRPAFNIYATPKQFTAITRAELSRMLGLSDDELVKIDERIAIGNKRDKGMPVLILEDQGRDRAALVEQSFTKLSGIDVHHEPYRYYPQGDLAAHLIGYMTQMTAAEADRLTNQGYDPSELVGRYGLESAWENYLRGKKGKELYAVDARGQRLDDKTAQTLISGERVTGAVPGANLVVTVDSELQKIAEKAVSNVSAAAVVIVEPKTGKIRALVSKPSFDPNVMTGHLTKAEETLLLSDPRKPFIDKALRATYPPGSVFKFITALAALEDGQGAQDESIFCAGQYQLSRTTFKCNGSHGKLDLIGAIQHSCNVYFWELAQRIGLDRMAEEARMFGFGAPTNLGLNGDAGGRIPTKAWYEKDRRYRVGFATNAATGQGDVEVTVLQMAMAYAALANGGTLFVPQIVERIEASDGRPIKTYDPAVARQVKISADALDTWHRGMWKVTNEKGGTAYDHGQFDLPVMGKTGTAEIRTRQKKEQDERDVEGYHPSRSHAWFAGWAPAEDPEIAIVVFVEHGGSGGRVAWPIAQRILDGYFTKIHPMPRPGAAPGGKPTKPAAARKEPAR